MDELFSKIRSLELGQKIVFVLFLFVLISIVIWVLDFMLSLEFLGFALIAYIIYQVFFKKV